MTLWGFLLFSLRTPSLASAAGIFALYLGLGAANPAGPWWVTILLIAHRIRTLRGKLLLSLRRELNPNMWSCDMQRTLSVLFNGFLQIWYFDVVLIKTSRSISVTCKVRFYSWKSFHLTVCRTLARCQGGSQTVTLQQCLQWRAALY